MAKRCSACNGELGLYLHEVADQNTEVRLRHPGMPGLGEVVDGEVLYLVAEECTECGMIVRTGSAFHWVIAEVRWQG